MTTTKYFTGVHTIEELKKLYHQLARKYHPDCGGDTETMQSINEEYEMMFRILKGAGNDKSYKEDNTEKSDDFINFINELFKNVKPEDEGKITVEICGSWIWVYGAATYAIKENLKKLGFRWSGGKKKWYWTAAPTKKHYRRGTSMTEIRNKYGSEFIDTKGRGKGGSGNSGMAPANC